MEILHRRQFDAPPRVSFVLLDWSCRESLHTLDFLAEQDVPREWYEIVWIEYFNRRDAELQRRIDDARREETADPVDAWIVMQMPENVCHHKHLMYNVGIVASRGELVCFCDSDAMMRPGFVRSILDAFERDPEIVLHHDEVRNRSPHFYPFRYPTFEDVLGPGCNNWVNGKAIGLWDEEDPLHTRNYGACMTARRDNLIAIGGADMHVDYLGHVCGPYELTFRLVNSGRREIWNDAEFLYHTWHPGQAGSVDYCGPHDGRHMSTTALEATQTGRVRPLEENPAIESLRTRGASSDDIGALLSAALKPEWLHAWSATTIAALPRFATTQKPSRIQTALDSSPTVWQQLRLVPLVTTLLARQYRIKYDKLRHACPSPPLTDAGRFRIADRLRTFVNKVRGAYGFLPAAIEHTKYLIRVCWLHLAYARTRGFQAVIVCGDAQATLICRRLAGLMGISVIACGAIEEVRDSNLPVLVASFTDGSRYRTQLNQLGVTEARIVCLS